MDYTSLVKVLDAVRKLARKLLGSLLWKRLELSALHECLEISAVVVLHHDEQHVLGFNDLNQIEYVAVPHAAENCCLALELRDHIPISVCFIYNFDGYLLACCLMHSMHQRTGACRCDWFGGHLVLLDFTSKALRLQQLAVPVGT